MHARFVSRSLLYLLFNRGRFTKKLKDFSGIGDLFLTVQLSEIFLKLLVDILDNFDKYRK